MIGATARAHAMSPPTGVNPWLSGGTRPAPNSGTSVNVWFLPPAFFTLSFSPSSIVRYPGAIRQDGCPTTLSENGEANKAVNSAFVTLPSRRMQPFELVAVFHPAAIRG